MIQTDSANHDSSLKVRKAELRDVLGVSRVCSDGWRDTYASIHAPEHIERVIYSLERISSEIDGPVDWDSPTYDWDGWLVAERGDGRLLGASGGGPTGERTWEVCVLYLDPNEQRRGIGRALLKAMTDQARARGASEQWVAVTAGNPQGIPFYEAMGFVTAHETDSPSGVKSLRMVRSIKP